MKKRLLSSIINILLCVIVSCLFHKVNAQAEIITRGYYLGMKTGHIVSEIPVYEPHSGHGGETGLKTGTILATPFLQLSPDLQNLSGYAVGISTAYVVAKEEELTINYIGREIIFLRKLYTALLFNIPDYLNKSEDRAKALDEHLKYLESLIKGEEKTMENFKARITKLKSQTKKNARTVTDLEKNFFEALDRFNSQQGQTYFTDFLDIAERNIKLKAILGAFTKMYDKHKFLFPLLTKRIQAIKANREALIRGIKVIDIEEVDIGIIERVSGN